MKIVILKHEYEKRVSGGNCDDDFEDDNDFILVLEHGNLFKRRSITGLTLLHFFVPCRNPGTGFQTPYFAIFFCVQ